MTHETLSIALIGTSRGGAAGIALPAIAQDAAAKLPPATPERTLLNRTAILFACDACGAKPTIATERVAECPPDERPPCSPRAAEILRDLITSNAHDLIHEWLNLAQVAKRRPPHRLLPALLDYAAKHPADRQRIGEVIDRRGHWLMSLNPEWQFGATADAAPDGVWQTGTHPQRLSVLRSLRQHEPARAREMIATSWKDEPAEQRADIVAALLVGLTADDEPFLESALDDRSKVVRAAAADLLARLPESQFVRRMIDRVTPRLVVRSRAAELEVDLPQLYDATMQRDGVEEKSPGKGQKQWWLEQMLGMVPPAHWSKIWKLAPREFMSLTVGDFPDSLLDGLAKACERCPDPAWIEPLLRRGLTRITPALNRSLLAVLPPARFLSFALDVLQSKAATLSLCSDLIKGRHVPLDVTTGRAFVRTVAELMNARSRQDVDILLHLIDGCAGRLPPSLHDEIASKWLAERERMFLYKRQVESLLETLSIRQQMHREFEKPSP